MDVQLAAPYGVTQHLFIPAVTPPSANRNVHTCPERRHCQNNDSSNTGRAADARGHVHALERPGIPKASLRRDVATLEERQELRRSWRCGDKRSCSPVAYVRCSSLLTNAAAQESQQAVKNRERMWRATGNQQVYRQQGRRAIVDFRVSRVESS